MSIKAMNWAMAARTDGVSAQCVLFVVADTANEHGVSVHADPDYIAARTRQSRATVFRRLDELERAGALARFTKHLADGRRIYEVRLHLDRVVDYEVSKEGEIAHRIGDYVERPQSQIETGDDGAQIETEPVSPVRPAESHSCDPQKSPSKSPRDNPPTPLAGGDHGQSIEKGEAKLSEFRAVYPIPITNMPETRRIWFAMLPDNWDRAIIGAKGYAAFLSSDRGRKRQAKDSHRWLRGREFEGYLDQGKRAEALAARFAAPEGSAEWNAWMVFYWLCGKRTGIPEFAIMNRPEGRFANVSRRWPPVGRGIDLPPDKWDTINAIEHRQALGAWLERLRELDPQQAISTIQASVNGATTAALRVPSIYPPPKGAGNVPAAA